MARGSEPQDQVSASLCYTSEKVSCWGSTAPEAHGLGNGRCRGFARLHNTHSCAARRPRRQDGTGRPGSPQVGLLSAAKQCVSHGACPGPSLLQQQDAKGNQGGSPQLPGRGRGPGGQPCESMDTPPARLLGASPAPHQQEAIHQPRGPAWSPRRPVDGPLMPPAHPEARGSTVRQLEEPIESHCTGAFPLTAQNRGT